MLIFIDNISNLLIVIDHHLCCFFSPNLFIYINHESDNSVGSRGSKFTHTHPLHSSVGLLSPLTIPAIHL